MNAKLVSRNTRSSDVSPSADDSAPGIPAKAECSSPDIASSTGDAEVKLKRRTVMLAVSGGLILNLLPDPVLVDLGEGLVSFQPAYAKGGEGGGGEGGGGEGGGGEGGGGEGGEGGGGEGGEGGGGEGGEGGGGGEGGEGNEAGEHGGSTSARGLGDEGIAGDVSPAGPSLSEGEEAAAIGSGWSN